MASVEDTQDGQPLCVVMNDEEQWSIWPVAKPVPAGWHATGVTGSKATCLSHIEQHWLDMRPLSVRRRFTVTPPSSTLATSVAEVAEVDGS